MSLADRICEVAAREVGNREQGGANRGPEIDQYVTEGGGQLGDRWCAFFVRWVVERACAQLNMPNPLKRTGSAYRMVSTAPLHMHTAEPVRGALFFHDSDTDDVGGPGHCGIVEHVDHGDLITIEGNTNDKGSRDGDGVLRKIRPRAYANMGFLDLTRAP